VRSGNLAPNHADLGASDLLLALVDVGDLLAKVEPARSVSSCSYGSNLNYMWQDVLGGVGVIDTLDLDQTRLGVGDMSATLVAQVASPVIGTWSAIVVPRALDHYEDVAKISQFRSRACRDVFPETRRVRIAK
jgi:hypothetical protein